MVYELAGAPSRPELWTLWPAAVLLCLSSKFFYSLAWGQRPGPSKLSREQLLWNPECSSRRKRLSGTKSSPMIWLSLPLCHSAPFLGIKELCGGHNSWLRLVGNSCFESSFGSLGWISFWLVFGHSCRQRNCLCGLAKIRKTKAMSSVDSMNSGPDGRFSRGPLSCGNIGPI